MFLGLIKLGFYSIDLLIPYLQNKPMITGKQIASARIFLDWTQERLAQETKLSKASIQNAERGYAETRSKNSLLIREVFESAGIEFIEDGVRVIKQKVRVLEGVKAITYLYDDIISTLRELPIDDRELLIFGVDELKFQKYYPKEKLSDHLALRRKYKISQKIFLKEGDKNLVDSSDTYRWIPKDYFNTTPTFVYGSKVATILYSSPIEVILTNNMLFADERRQNFKLIWDKIAFTDSSI